MTRRDASFGASVGILIGILTAGCLGDVELTGLPDADHQAFVEDVQPVLSERCANPSCHGTALRPLELYAPSLHRADPEDTHVADPLTEDELRANFDRSRAFLLDVEAPNDCLFLSKPLAVAAGGTVHADVDVFETTDDPEYRQLRRWVRDALERDEEFE